MFSGESLLLFTTLAKPTIPSSNISFVFGPNSPKFLLAFFSLLLVTSLTIPAAKIITPATIAPYPVAHVAAQTAAAVPTSPLTIFALFAFFSVRSCSSFNSETFLPTDE